MTHDDLTHQSASPDAAADHAPVRKRPRSIALLNQKGGVGKTTSSVNLAAAFAEQGKQVCLIDLDPQAHVALHLGVDLDGLEHTVYDLLIDPDVEAIDTVVSARKNLDVLVSEVDLAGAESELVNRPNREHILRDKFQPIADFYDIVMIDCPPSLGQLTLNALTMVQEVFVPMQAHFLALQGVGKLLETVGLVCQSVNPQLRVSGIILCMHEGQTTLGKEVVADLDAFFDGEQSAGTPWEGCSVYRPFIRRNIKLAEAPSFGQTIFDYAPWCKGAIDYRKLASHILMGIDGRQFYDEAGRPVFELARRSNTQADASNRPAVTTEIETKPDAPAESTDGTSDETQRDTFDDAPASATDEQAREQVLREDESSDQDQIAPPLIELISLRLPPSQSQGSHDDTTASGGPISLQRGSDSPVPGIERAADWSQQRPAPATTPADRYGQ